MSSSLTTLVWFRRDLRLTDNPAFNAAADGTGPVIPVFIYSPDEEHPWEPGGASKWWLHHSLRQLAESLMRKNSRLVLRTGGSLKVLEALIKETGAARVFWNRCYEPALIERDTQIKSVLKGRGIETESFCGDLLVEPWKLKNKQGKPYKVYTPFSNQIVEAVIEKPLPQPKRILAPSRWPNAATLESLELEPRTSWDAGLKAFWKPGESNAVKQLEFFGREAVMSYSQERDRPDHAGTSRLAPYLRFGEVSPRQVWQALPKNVKTLPFLRQILWREFAAHLLYHFPRTPAENLRPNFDRFPWGSDKKMLKAWQKGKTGYPIVDAGMRELWHTGWMHNRVRMVAASFLVKDLLISWQEGARWFWDTLVDADLANNTMGWQWVAGSGADAAPYFRIFNPVSQGERFDPQGNYVRKWIPEIASIPDRWIHQPWAAPEAILNKSGVRLGRDYPEPVIDHEFARRRALMSYEKVRKA